MKTLFPALEDNTLGVATIDPTSDIVAPEPIMGDAEDQVLVTDRQLFDQMAQHVDVAKTISGTIEALRGPGAGLQAPVGQALNVAVEGLLATINLPAPTMQYRVQMSNLARAHNSSVAIEGLTETLSAVWKRLLAMLRDFGVRISKAIKKRYASLTSLKAKVKKAEEDIAAKRKQSPVSDAPTINLPYFQDPAMAARLCLRDGSVPQGNALLRSALDHFAVMRHLYEANELVFNSTGVLLGHAADRIMRDADDFTHLIGEALATMQTPIIHRVCAHPDREYPAGVKLYEEPLIFGGRSYFRTSTNSVIDFNLGDMVARVGRTYSARDSDPEQKLYYLTAKHPEDLITAIKSHVTIQNTYLDTVDSIKDKLETMTKTIEHYVASGNLDEEADRRGRQVSKAISLLMAQIGSLTDLAGYDNAICESLLNYAVLSVN